MLLPDGDINNDYFNVKPDILQHFPSTGITLKNGKKLSQKE